MDLATIQALVMGLTQGLTEFLPISSSGHLILVPWLFGWTVPVRDDFINSLAFTVMLHMGTLLALLVYFWREWLKLIPAGLAAIRDRSLAGDPDRKMAWLIVVATIPAVLVGPILTDTIESWVREPARVAFMLCVGAAILWLADRWGSRQREMDSLTFGGALGIGVAQVLALVPGISRSGISISAGLFQGLNREAAARFSFLMATPVVAGAGVWEARKLLTNEAGVNPEVELIVVGFVAAAISGLLAIRFMLEFLRRRPLTVFVVYRVAAAILVFVVLLSPHGA
ncbi:MAG TPA: undecaprenyl-diphosphatase UppP [Candidatus Limnocylindrales bacterium]|jgi:undecaprenyl-diphosphatase